MTTLLLCSDLHTNFHRDGGKSLINGLYDKNVDIAVVAGDLSVTVNNLLQDNIKQLCDKFPEVVFVSGNHSYYHSTLKRVDGILGDIESKTSNFTWLNDSRVVVDGVPFIGGTLWFPRSPTANANEHLLNDFNCILDVYDVYDRHEATVDFFEQNMQEDDIVVTHHMPTYRSVAPKYKASKINCYFTCDLDDMIKNKKPKAWLHAHSHSSCDYLYHSTRIVCNPFGYPGENPQFFDAFTIGV